MLISLFGSPRRALPMNTRENQSLSKWLPSIKLSNIQSSCTFGAWQTRKTFNDTHLLQKKYTWPSLINTVHFSFVKVSSLILLGETLSNGILKFPIPNSYWLKYWNKPHCESHGDFYFTGLNQEADQPSSRLHLFSFQLPSPSWQKRSSTGVFMYFNFFFKKKLPTIP